MSSALYFAYGSNLHMDAMATRCPESVPVRPQTLKDWKLVFRGYADIVPAPGKIVEGALYSLSTADIEALDIYEGVAGGLYHRHTMVLDDTGEEIFFYVMRDGDILLPVESYLEIIETGYSNWHIPMNTLNEAIDHASSAMFESNRL